MTEQPAVGRAGARAQITLRPRASAPRAVRRMVRRLCRASALPPQIVDNATLVASELVTDRIRQVRSRLEVTVEAGHQSVTIRVRDHDAGPPPRVHADRVGSQRSREIVHQLASSWGYADGMHGWAAWASLRSPVT